MRVRDPLRHSRGHRILVAVALAGLALLTLRSEARAFQTCMTAAEPLAGPTIDTVGAYKGLIVFARFPDADLVSLTDGSALPVCTGCGDGWAATDTYPPSWAGDLIDASTSSMTDGSLTHFFSTWSQGDFQFTGAILDTVFELTATVKHYEETYGPSLSNFSPLQHANEDLIAQIDPFVDFSDYDGNSDGIVDFVFVLYQSGNAYYSSLDTTHSVARDFSAVSTLATTTVTTADVIPGTSTLMEVGPGGGATLVHILDGEVVQHPWAYTGLMAHEMIHDFLGRYFGGNHIENASRYSMMQGNFRMPLMMSPVVRYKNNWIDPVEINPSTFPYDTSLALSADYTDHEGTLAIIRPAAAVVPNRDQYWILEARKAGAGLYATSQPPSCSCSMLTPGTGLLISHVCQGGGPTYGLALPPFVDIEIATGHFDPTGGHPDPVSGSNNARYNDVGGEVAQSGDLFLDQTVGGSTRSNTWAPYTNPSSNLYVDSGVGGGADETIYSGISVYNIRWNAAKDSILCDIHIEDPTVNQTGPDTLYVDTTWQGLVQLTNDLVIPPGVTLSVEEDAQVVARAAYDREGGGLDTGVTELIVQGDLNVNGGAERPRFTSSRDDTFLHWRANNNSYPGETTAPAAGDWRGVQLIDAMDGSFGTVDSASLAYADFAIGVDSLSGNLFDNEFENNTVDIYLPQDVRIPAGKTWRLQAPTNVRAANSDPNGTGEDVNRVELINEGRLETFSANPGQDSVFFNSETPDPTFGEGWAGITALWTGITVLASADIGSATTGFSALVADTTEIRDSRIHHYRDQALLDWASDATLVGSTIERGVGLVLASGQTGVQFVASTATIESNTVGGHSDYGIRVEWSDPSCSYNYSVPLHSPDTLTVSGNTVTGFGEPSQQGTPETGILISWVCDSTNAVVESNVVTQWNRGLDLFQVSDVLATCGTFDNNRIGVRYERTDRAPLGSLNGTTKFHQNAMKDTYDAGIEIPTGIGLEIGDTSSPPDPGKNSLQLDSSNSSSLFMIVDAVDPSNQYATLQAARNTWFQAGSSTPWTDITGIRSKLDETVTGSVGLNPPRSSESLCTTGSLAGPGVAHDSGDQDRLDGGSPPEGMDAAPGVLTVRRLSQNPSRHARIRWAVGLPERAERISIAVFDVAGRRVATMEEVPNSPGWHAVEWDARAPNGHPVAPGIYFLRVSGPTTAALGRIAILN